MNTIVVYQEQSQTLTLCSEAFLAEIRTHGEVIDFNVSEIARKVRDYIWEHPDIPVETVYYEVATFALRGRRPRTVRYWVEAIAGFEDRSLAGWQGAGLTMQHMTAARRLYRDGKVDSPAQALDACVNERESEDRPLTVTQMETLFDPPPTVPEELWSFREWLRSVLERRPPQSWDASKQRRFLAWLMAGKDFL